MNDETHVHAELKGGPSRGEDASSAKRARIPAGDAPRVDGVRPIVIASTFTADPIQQPLRFWMETLDISADITMAPYAQLMQELLNPESVISKNKLGFSAFLIRLEDWIRDRMEESVEQNIEHIRGVASDFVTAMRVLRGRTSATTFMFFCPPSSSLPLAYGKPLEQIERDLVHRLRVLEHVHCSTHPDLVRLYPVAKHEDTRADRIGHIPYTNEYFVAIATMLARRVAALMKPRYKVIATDCDNTLWKGVCGEDGPDGIQLTPAHLELQRMLVRQHDAGMLICICSKNNTSDVEAVFRQRPEMPLRAEHLISSRMNWSAKSSNLRSLSRELDLGLDSFILVDDSPMEIAEVQAHCPAALTLKYPDDPQEVTHFLDHIWAFDRIGVTEEAKARTSQYKQNRARVRALEQAPDLRQFLASLQLKVDVSTMRREQLIRVAELIQRTNQFNLTTLRRTVGEIETLCNSGDVQCLVVHVKDRFGDYGLVGALLLHREPSFIDVDTFTLSCRVLGRGVEHRIVNELGRIATQEGRGSILLRYRRTQRNAPACTFIENSFGQFEEKEDGPSAGTRHFKIPVEYAENLGHEPAASELANDEATPAELPGATESTPRTNTWHEASYRLSRLGDIVQEINRSAPQRNRGPLPYVAPRTPTEAAVAGIWAEVLGLAEVSVSADFFELGGNSLLAVQVIARVGSVLDLDLSIYEFFEGPTVEEVASKLGTASQAGLQIKRTDRNGPLPLSLAQQRLWFIDQLEGGSAAYYVPIALRLNGELDRLALQAVLDALIERHEALRTTFTTLDGKPVQEIASEARFELQFVDLRTQPPEEREAEVLRQSRDELATTFDLSGGPLIRGRLLQLSADEHVLLITMHHIISDGWSIGVLIQEVGVLYEACREARHHPLPSLPVQYADYAQWQRRWLEETGTREQLSYWEDHLRGAPELLELPTDRSRPSTQSYRGAGARVSLGAGLTADLKALSRQFNLTLAMTLYAAWLIVLSRLSGQQDIVVGMPVANRLRTEIEGLIGFFVNTLAVRVRLEGNPRVVDLLHRVKETMLGAYANQEAPFEQVVEAVKPVRSLSHSPVFQVMFVLHAASRAVIKLPRLTMIEQEVPPQTAQYDLSLLLQESEDGITGWLNYASDLFDHATMQRWVKCFEVVLRGTVLQSHQKVSRLPLLTAAERRDIVERFNDTQGTYPREKLIHELFEEQARRTPDAVAVVHEGWSLTYGDLNNKANQLARYLRAKGIGSDQLVCIRVERSVEMVVGLLGILKAGAAYVPLDPSYPTERLAYILKDAKPAALLIQSQPNDGWLETAVEMIALDRDWGSIARHITTNPVWRTSEMRSHQLAYVIYTSGSTGQPKGVMIEHRSVINLWKGLEPLYGRLGGGQRIALNASLSFDASVQQFVQLLSGRTLFIVPQESRRDASLLLNFIDQHRIEGIDCTPSQLKSWIAAGLLRAGKCPLRTVLVGGEAIDPELWIGLARCSDIDFFNVYGPTECTVDATVAHLNGDEIAPNIGRPMENRCVYILDQYGQPLPIGVVGEIFIGGVGVGRGYLNRPELTAERFQPDPFTTDPRARLYRTGDLGRWRVDGTIEYLGRNDNQVKVRGFRIELGEIEEQLLRHEQVSDAVVIAREDAPGEKRLVAYMIPRDTGLPLNVEALRTHLKAVLPEHMVPSAFVRLDCLPLTSNGKLDRRALPAPELDAYSSQEYEAPQGEVEEILAGIWQALLRVRRIGRQDNFFELGGHSLLIVQMMERIRSAGLSADVRCVFENPTLADLARALAPEPVWQFELQPNLIPDACEAITPQMLPLVELQQQHIESIAQSVPGGATNIQDIYPLAPSQEGILFHHLLNEQGGDVYVLPTLLSVSSRVRLEELIASLQQVIDRHDVLRTAVRWEQLPIPVQVVYRRAALPVAETTLDPHRDSAEQVKEWIRPERQRIDIRQAPPIRLQVAADGSSGQWYVLLQLHHITIDHVTLEILISEVIAHLQGHARQLPPSVPYRNHVAQSLAYARSQDAETFFRRKLGQIGEPTAPFGLLDVHGDGTQVEEAYEEVEAAVAQRTRTQARRYGVSAATLFHAAWALVVASTSRRDDVVFGSVLLGRLQGSAGAQRILGMFINTLPLRLQLRGVSAEELVEQAQRELVELLGHEQAPLAVAQRCSGITGTAPLFTALFNYRHSASSANSQWASGDGVRALAIQERTNYPITLSVDDLGEGFVLTAQTDRRIDPRRMTGCLHVAVHSLVQALEKAPRTLALALPILPEGERRQVIDLFNATQATYPREKSIHQLFEEQVERAPGATAVTYEGQSLTYAELNSKANQLARYLRSKGLGPDQLVGICVERSLHMVIGLLGILKSGGAYVPLDPDYPIERLQYMLDDAAPKVVLTQKSVRAVLPTTATEVIELDEKLKEITDYVAENLPATELCLSTQNLVYVIYTSGSTGRPKGTAMPHRSMVNLVEWHRQYLPNTEGPRVLQFAALSFDVAFQEIFTTICMGGTLVLPDEWVRRDARGMMELLSSEHIDRLFVPPIMLQSLAECFKSSGMGAQSLKDVITAGEQLRISPEIVNLFNHVNGCRLHNHYGPTETHVVTALTLSGNPEEWPALPSIGQPISNTQVYVLDGRHQPVPIGVVGEIYIGGANVARGYLNRFELTAERFLRDPFSHDARARMYKTGDLGRWRADGTIEYLGRDDDQVKIRGYRIELGEIEAQLARHSKVREAAVVVREDVPGEKRLVGYVTQRDRSSPSVEELRTYLKDVLPDYMVPSAIVILACLPLTPSGKLNRRALPAPELDAYASQQYESPQGEIEEAIAWIWREVLQIEQVGREDNFFDIGGHSLLAVKVLFKVNECLGSGLRVTDVYTNPTIRDLAACVRGSTIGDELIDLQREAAVDEQMVAKPGRRSIPERAVMLSGATGFIGRFLLAQLLQDTDATIYCLVRARSQHQASFRLRTTLEKWDLWRDELESRIVAVPGDLRLSRLGIDETTYESLSREIDSIYHCGTSMNHLETYAMARAANVESAREILKLATNHKPKLINYLSTMSIFRPSAQDSTRVVDEESPIDHENHRSAHGYAASKWVGEKIFMTASDRGIPCNIFRLGFIWADTQLGRYDELQRGYRILKSCLMSGYGIESFRYHSPPTPVDYAARAVVYLANTHCDGRGIFHISSSREMIEGLFECCNRVAGTSLELLPYYEWVGEIKRLHHEGRSLPIVPLIEVAFSMDEESFYEHERDIQSANVPFDCTRTHRELEDAGIVAPVLNEDLLRVSVESILSRDADFHEYRGGMHDKTRRRKHEFGVRLPASDAR